MTSFPPIQPLDAALELRRRGLPLPPEATRILTDYDRQSFMSAHQGMIRPGLEAPPNAEELGITTFKFPTPRPGVGNWPSQPPAIPVPSPATPTAPRVEDRYNLPRGEQSLLPARSPGTEMEMIVAERLRELESYKDPQFEALSPQEKLAAAHRLAQLDTAAGRGRNADFNRYAMEALGRLQGELDGSSRYQSPDQKAQDEELVREYARQQTTGAYAREAGPVTAGLMGFRGALGFTPPVAGFNAIQDRFNPELQGVEGAVAAERPWSTGVGAFTGGALPVLMGAGAAAGAAEAGVARLLHAAGNTAAKRFMLGASRWGGAFVGGELTTGPIGAASARAQGADWEQALQAAGESVAAYPIIVSKLKNGEPLTPDDWLNVMFLAPELGAVRGDIYRAMTGGKPIKLRQRDAIIAALEKRRLADPSVEQIAREALQAYSGRAPEGGGLDQPSHVSEAARRRRRTREPIEAGEPGFRSPLLDEDGAVPYAGMPGFEVRAQDTIGEAGDGLDRMGTLDSASSFPGEPKKQFTTDYGDPVQIEALPDGTYRWTMFDQNGQPIVQQVQANLAWATRMANATSAKMAGQPLPGDIADIGELGNIPSQRIEVYEGPSGVPFARAEADVAGIKESFSSRLTPTREAVAEQRLRVDESMARAREAKARRRMQPEATPEPAPAPEAEPTRQYAPGQVLRPKEKAQIRKAMKARTYTPGGTVHTTSLDVLARVAQHGIQPTKDADGDVSVSASTVDESGKVQGGALSYGRKGVPVVLELSDRVQRADTGPGDTFVRSEGNSFVRPEDIERVWVGDDPKPYTLQEAVAKFAGGEPSAAPPPIAAPKSPRRAAAKKVSPPDRPPPPRPTDADVRAEAISERAAEIMDAGEAADFDDALHQAEIEYAAKGKAKVEGVAAEPSNTAEAPSVPPKPKKKARVKKPTQPAPDAAEVDRLRAKEGLLARRENLDTASRVELEAVRQRLAELEGQAAESPEALVERATTFFRGGPSGEEVQRFLGDLDAEELATLRSAFKKKPRWGKAVREEIVSRGGEAEGVALSTRGMDLARNAAWKEAVRRSRRSFGSAGGEGAFMHIVKTKDAWRVEGGRVPSTAAPGTAYGTHPGDPKPPLGGGAEGVALSTNRPKKPRGSGATPPGRVPRTAAGPAPSKSSGSKRVRQRVAQAKEARALRTPDSPHRIMADLNRKMGLAPHGVLGSSLLKKAWGLYRVAPQSIRLRYADDLDTHIHEVAHHLHKMIFQGGLTINDLDKIGRRITKSGLDPSAIPYEWHAELRQVADATGIKGPRVTEGWAELIRLMFTDPETAKGLAPRAYRKITQRLIRDHGREYEALQEFRVRYQLYTKSSAATKVASYIRRVHEKRPFEAWLSDTWHNFYTVAVDRAHPLLMLKRDLFEEEGVLSPDNDPYYVALRSFGRATGDYERALKHGRFDPADHRKVTGRPLEAILNPYRRHMVELETYMIAARALEKRTRRTVTYVDKNGDTVTKVIKPKKVLGSLTGTELKQAMTEIETVIKDNLGLDIKEAAKEFQEFNEWLIRDYAVGHGLITKARAEKIIAHNLNYITMRTVDTISASLVAARVQAVAQGKKFTGPGTGIRYFKEQAGEQIEPPVAAFMSSMHSIMSRAQMNRVGQSLTDVFGPRPHGGTGTIEGIGNWVDAVDQKMDPVSLYGKEVVDEIVRRAEASGIDIDDLDADTMEALFSLMEDKKLTFFRPGIRTHGERGFIVLKDGKPTFWEAKNDRLFRFLEGFNNPPAIEGALRWMTMPRVVLRAGATQLNPSFAMVNFLRDTLQAMVYSDNPRYLGGYVRKGDMARIKAMWRTLLSGRLDEAYLASGANMSNLFGEYWDHGRKQLDVDRMFLKATDLRSMAGIKEGFGSRLDYMRTVKRNHGMARFVWEWSKLPFVGLDSLNQRFELANRVGEFEATLWNRTGGERAKATRADIEAAGQAAADITLDFQRGGTLAMQINQFVPFFNAAIQGTDRFARFIKKDPYKAIGRLINYTVMPSLAVHLLNREDEQYYKIPLEQRDRYWHIPLGDLDGDGKHSWFRFPKPYSIGSLAVLADRAFTAVDGINPATGERGDREALTRGLGPDLSDPFKAKLGAILQDFRVPYNLPVVTPLYELAANYSFFFGGPVVHKGEQVGPQGERGAERSSNFAAAMGDFLDVEPPKIDYAIQGFFGGLGTDINRGLIDPLLDVVSPKLRDRPKTQEAVGPENWPILRRIFTEEPRTWTENTIRFWNMFQKLEDIQRGWSRRREYRYPDADEYRERHQGALRMYSSVQPFRTRMNNLFKQLKMLRTSDLGEEELRDRQNELYRQINDTAAAGYRRFMEMEAE